MEQKKELERHTTILKGKSIEEYTVLWLAVMEQINLREIPNFFDYENTVKDDGKLDISEVCSFLKEKVPIFVIPNI